MRRGMGFALAAAIVASSIVIATSLSGHDRAEAAPSTLTSGSLHATIRRTSHGIPHILADDYAGLGFGYGYALAQDNICVLADIYVTVDGERSRFSGSSPLGSFGPNGSWAQGGNGTAPNNLNSDFFFQRVKDRGTIEALLAQDPPSGPAPLLREGVRGYVAGYNKYLAQTGVDNLPDATCRGKDWVRPITEMDAYRRFYQLGLIGSQGVMIDGIGGAAPVADPGPLPTQADFASIADKLPLGGVGSNAVALGPDATDNGKGMLLGNPHFPWDGSERFYESQLTIPGVVNVEGGSLFGVPVINIGHTDHLAWSHTVSTAYRFTPFELRLVPGDPHSYLYDGQIEHMRAEDVTVQVRSSDGSISPQTRTLYSTQPHDQGGGGGYSIFDDLLGIPLPWGPTTAWAIGDANAGNFRYLNHFFEVNHAQSVSELEDIIKRNQGVPWVNTLASDSSGDAFYADISVTPKVTDEEADACNTEVGRAAFAALGLPFLDGSLSTCEWASPAFGGSDPDAIDPATFGPSHMPSLHTNQYDIRDYVTNSNDSYWLSNPEHPLEGFDRIIGDERTERALRTRSGLQMVEDELGGPSGSGTFTLQELQDMVFADRQYAGELWRDQLAAFCETSPSMAGSNGPVDVSEACPVLRAWDVHDDLDSNGAILFRRFVSHVLSAGQGLVTPPGIFLNQFDANDPVHTPNGLNTANPLVEQSLADAVTDLRDAGIPLDAPLRGWQYERRGSERIPIHGGPGTLGVFNAINVGWTGSGSNPGYTNVPHGSSFVMAAQFTDGDCPVDARTILTYSQSTNPDSPYFADQTRMFSNKQWVNEAYCEDEIAADPNLQVETISDGYPRPKGATPLRVPLVPAFKQCTVPNRTHGAPLAFGSCAPPDQVSQDLTVGTPDANGKPAASVGYVLLKAISCPACVSPLPNADVRIDASMTDVRNRVGLGDYTGSLEGRFSLRLTDRFNAASPDDPQTDAATVVDSPFKFTIPCAATSDPSGGACDVSTSANAVMPGSVRDGDRAIWQLGSIVLYDASEKLFATQGLFVP
jgi:acyl-homoserine-lactone acylase